MNSLLGLIAAPLFIGVINRTKALFSGRKGQPLLQPYFDLLKLLKKGAVYSRTTTWIFRASPIVGLASVLTILFLVPFGGDIALMSFKGDLVFFAYLFGIMRFFTVIAALDTGSGFEGMGASREVTFSALCEPALLLGLAVICSNTGEMSLSHMLEGVTFNSWQEIPAPLALVTVALFVVFLAENSRIPVDDPNTHLELTMVHEVMVLDHGGPDFAFILYAAALKIWILGSLIIAIVLPVHEGNPLSNIIISIFGMLVLAVAVGAVESVMARFRFIDVPRLLLGANACSLIALILEFSL